MLTDEQIESFISGYIAGKGTLYSYEVEILRDEFCRTYPSTTTFRILKNWCDSQNFE